MKEYDLAKFEGINDRNKSYPRQTWRSISQESTLSTISGLSEPNSPIDDHLVRCQSTEPIIPTYDDKYSKLRSYLSQFVACSSIMLILSDKGMAASHPTNVVGELYKQNATDEPYVDNFKNMSFFVKFPFDNSSQSSTYASIGHICQPLGSLLGGFIIDIIGRKKMMILLNMPMFIGWQLLYFSRDCNYLYSSNALFGIGTGLAESPIATYVSEVSEMEIRSTILTLALLFKTASNLVPFIVILSVDSWRWTSIILSGGPILAAIVSAMVPESPSWLMSKNRKEDAVKSMTKLRGWVKRDQVQEEIDKLSDYHDREKSMSSKPSSGNDVSSNRSPYRDHIVYLTSYRIRRPFFIIVSMFVVSHTAGMLTIGPYLEIIVKELGIKMDERRAAMFITLCGGAGNLTGVILIHKTGKRVLCLFGLAGNALSALIIALISQNIVSSHYSLYAFFVMAFCTWLGIAPIPWILQGELFPFTGRGTASGAAAALNNIIAFVLIKTFIQLKDLIQLWGMFYCFTGCSLVGMIFVYFKLPETEGKSKEEIEAYFSDVNNNDNKII